MATGMIAGRIGLAEEGSRGRAEGTAGVRGGTYRGQLISTGGTHPRSRRQKSKREALSYVIFTPSCLLIYHARYLFSLMPLPPSLMTSPPLSLRGGHIPQYIEKYIYIYIHRSTRFCVFSHPPPVLSISAPPFLRRSYGLRAAYRRATQPPARPFVYPAISIVDRYDVDYTPRAVIPPWV